MLRSASQTRAKVLLAPAGVSKKAAGSVRGPWFETPRYARLLTMRPSYPNFSFIQSALCDRQR